jgi:DNA-binding response OmpR family regulator
MHKVLVVEDSEESKNLIYQALGADFEMVWAQTIAETQKKLNENSYDIILLDVGLPDGDGFHFFSMLQQTEFSNISVIFLTAKDETSAKVLGLSLGAEDYIVKPFEAQELKARVEGRLKKNLASKQKAQVIQKGPIEIQIASQRVSIINAEGQRQNLDLTPLEFKVLLTLASREDRVFSREELLNLAWSDNTHVTDRSIDTHIYSLRKKLGEYSSCIEAVYGQGYRFITPTRASSEVPNQKVA